METVSGFTWLKLVEVVEAKRIENVEKTIRTVSNKLCYKRSTEFVNPHKNED